MSVIYKPKEKEIVFTQAQILDILNGCLDLNCAIGLIKNWGKDRVEQSCEYVECGEL
jgi:hypothetical protein